MCVAQSDDDLPRPDEIEVEFQDLYRHDEEQAYVTLMSQDIKSINFPCEENYTVRLCVRACPKHLHIDARSWPCGHRPCCCHTDA